MGDEKDLLLQISEERREMDAADAKRDERMSVLEAKFDSLASSHRLMLAGFITMCITVVGGAAAVVYFGGGG